MPSINLRLSEEQHDELRRWALDSKRSVQKEIIYRLFSTLTERGEAGTANQNVEVTGDAHRRSTDAGRTRLAARSPDVPRSASADSEDALSPAVLERLERNAEEQKRYDPDDHFKPDFKKGK